MASDTAAPVPLETPDAGASLFDFSLTRLNDTVDILNFAELKGKVVLCVNVASFCGQTFQYWDLNKLQEKYEKAGLQFGNQELCREDEILNCLRFVRPGQGYPGPNFPLTRKVTVNGPDAHPIYKAPDGSSNGQRWLADTTARGLRTVPCEGSDVTWNFTKFLVSRDGQRVRRFAPTVLPLDPALTGAVEELLADSA